MHLMGQMPNQIAQPEMVRHEKSSSLVDGQEPSMLLLLTDFPAC